MEKFIFLKEYVSSHIENLFFYIIIFFVTWGFIKIRCSYTKLSLLDDKRRAEVYNKILERIELEDKKQLILLALGPTATILAYDLAKEGYQAVDIGHMDIEYEWYLRKADRKIDIENKAVNEVSGVVDKEIKDRELKAIYESQIIDRISLD